ncbi:DNA methylase [Anaerococcus octavius]|uniref:DNA methylase n=1 Tax=Anaerococcus octavius TaxID=54007 RepID=A0A380WU30_9FIRM|nr:DNA methylase [Anaerococcus octavius]
MQVNDFKNIQEAIKYEVLQDEKEYLKLLKVIGNNQKYDFSSQLSIYNKEPEARTCATFDMWKKYFGRVVMRGQKGIPILVGSDINKKISYIFDISQTTSMDRNINEVSLWKFDHENHNEALKEIIRDSSFEASDSLNENIFSLSRIYGDEYINLALADLRIDIEDRLSFEKFMRDAISYAVANRFNTVYPMDMENLKNNFSRINTISLEQIGLVISKISEDIIDSTIEKSKEIDRSRLLTERAGGDYNRDIENTNEDRGGQEVEMDEFSQMEATEEIAMKIEEKTLDMMEKDLEFMEKFPNPTYAVLRLSYLVGSEDMENWKKLQEMYEEKTLLNHLKEIQTQAVDYIKREKVKMMKTQGLTEKMMRENPEEYQGQMNNLMTTVKKMAIKEYVEA